MYTLILQEKNRHIIFRRGEAGRNADRSVGIWDKEIKIK